MHPVSGTADGLGGARDAKIPGSGARMAGTADNAGHPAYLVVDKCQQSIEWGHWEALVMPS